MIDVAIITGSGIYDLPGEREEVGVQTRFGRVEVSRIQVGPWRVGSISRHRPGHRYLPHAVPHEANLAALHSLGARAVLATTAVGAMDPLVKLGIPLLFDDLFFPENRLPDGRPCTIFTEPDDPKRGHLIQEEPFSPRLRQRMELAGLSLRLEMGSGGVYGHVNGPRFNTAAEIRSLREAGVAAVSQTCGPEAVLAGELEVPYALVGFPVNYTPGAGETSREEMERTFALSREVLPRLMLRAAELLQEEDFAFDHGFVYRVEGGL